MAELEPGQDLIVAGCGRGVTTEWLARRTGASVAGIDPDEDDIAHADERARSAGLPLSYQQGVLDDLPYESDVFDAAIGEPDIAATDAERAVAELVRVTKPMGAVVLLQLTWSSELDESRRELVVERLGLRPRLLVEWKQMLRDAGVVDIQVNDWTNECDEELADDCDGAPFQFNWQDKLQIMGRAFRRSGWSEARHALVRETQLLRDLSRERSMNFSIIKGVKWPQAAAPGREA